MSIAALGTAGVLGGTLGRVVADSATVRARLDTLSQQAATGRVADTFAGLHGNASASLSIGPAIAHIAQHQKDIDAAAGRMGVAQTALKQISSIASTLFAQTGNLNGLSPGEVESVAGQARDALRQVAGLLDTRDGDVYVFAGQDSANPPIPDPDAIGSSGFATQITTAVSSLAGSGAAATVAATLAAASSNAAGTSPFSTALSQPAATVTALRTSISVDDGQSVPTGIVAGANADVTSIGTSTTGSYIRDILRGLATLGSLTGAQATVNGFHDLVADTRNSLGDAISALNQDAGVLGDRQSALTDRSTTLGEVSTALQSQLSSAQDVDMTATLSELSRVQTQLQSSYQLISTLRGLSLTSYLSG